MRKLIPLFLSLIISVPTFAAVTDEECRSKNKSECGTTAGCGWVVGNIITQGYCKACQKDEYSISVVSTNNNELACKKCSDINKYTNPDTGEVITYGSSYYKYTLGAGRTITDCYANCELMAQELSKNNGKWVSTGSATAYYPNKCQFACYTSDNGYNICNSYYDTTGKKEICTPTWKLLDIGDMDAGDISDFEIYECDNATKGIAYYFFDMGFTNGFCFARECASGYHLADAPDELYAYGIYPEEYSCKFADNTEISNAEMFQTCESNIRKCSNYFGASCKVTIDGTEYTGGTVKGDAIWNGTNAYTTDGCTCTVSTSVTEGTYEHVCKRSTTSNTWDGTNCETTIESCNPGYCVDDKIQRCAATKRGYYSDGRDNGLECRKCPAGKTTEGEKSTNEGACSYSPETQFCDRVGCFNLNYTSLQ